MVGGGIVGLATATALAAGGRLPLVVLEAEAELASHQSGRNSGVIHSGLYYRPGSVKAELCVAGRDALYRFCEERGIPHRRCGKVVVAVRPEELPALDELERRGRANGLASLRRLSPEEIREYEPHAAGVAALWVGETGVVDFRAVSRALADELESAGAEVRTGWRVTGIVQRPAEIVVTTPRGEVRCRRLINCAGLQSDRIARLAGVEPAVRIVPFRGEYFALKPDRCRLVRAAIYPVPDPRLPFLGVHLTRDLEGGVHAGPNAVLAWRREGYSRRSFSLRDAAETLGFPGTWRLAARFWRAGAAELRRSLSRRAFAADVARLVPEIGAGDLVPAPSGVRAQAVDRGGQPLDDFCIERRGRTVHVLNAPSPAATAALAIGRRLAELALAE